MLSMDSREVFPLFVEAYGFVKSILGSRAEAEYYQDAKKTEEESGLEFFLSSKRGSVGLLYIWKKKGAKMYYIGWWIDSEHEDLFFSSRRQFSSWKKKIRPILKTFAGRRSR